MQIFSKNQCWVFDLDDTIYKEILYVKSAYCYIAEQLEGKLGKNIFDELWAIYCARCSVFDVVTERYEIGMTVEQLVFMYRYHTPKIELDNDTKYLLETIKVAGINTALITDGRSISQRNKLKSLGLESYFDIVVISEELGTEKPNEENYRQVMRSHSAENYIYVGDNFTKDFITPNFLGWTTIGLLDNGSNIHHQDLKLAVEYLPKYFIKNLSIEEIKKII
jgi:putative hydrolase of the HAD superfamily